MIEVDTNILVRYLAKDDPQQADGPFGSKLKTADYTESGIRVARLENIGHLSFLDDKKPT